MRSFPYSFAVVYLCQWESLGPFMLLKLNANNEYLRPNWDNAMAYWSLGNKIGGTDSL